MVTMVSSILVILQGISVTNTSPLVVPTRAQQVSSQCDTDNDHYIWVHGQCSMIINVVFNAGLFSPTAVCVWH